MPLNLDSNSASFDPTAVGAFTAGTLFKTPEEENNFEMSADSAAKKTIAKLIAQDTHIDDSTRSHLLNLILGPDPLSTIFSGAAGAALAYTISKLLKLKDETRNLLSLAGFGAGVIIANTLNKTAPGTRRDENGTTHLLGH